MRFRSLLLALGFTLVVLASVAPPTFAQTSGDLPSGGVNVQSYHDPDRAVAAGGSRYDLLDWARRFRSGFQSWVALASGRVIGQSPAPSVLARRKMAR
jgi:hypothetical protein